MKKVRFLNVLKIIEVKTEHLKTVQFSKIISYSEPLCLQWIVQNCIGFCLQIPKKRKEKSLPAIKLNQEKRNKKHIKNENTTTTQHGAGLNKIYDIQKEAKGKSSLAKTDKKSKKGGKKHISKPSSTYAEEHLKITANRNQDRPKKPISKQRNSEVNQNKVQSKSVETPIKRRNRYFNENKSSVNL